MTKSTPHDLDLSTRIYLDCKQDGVAHARRLLSTYQQNRWLRAFDAEELYDSAWEKYFKTKDYLHTTDNHTPRINALIHDCFVDELRKALAQKRVAPEQSVDRPERQESLDDETAPRGTTFAVTASSRDPADVVAERDEIGRALARIPNSDDARALVDNELRDLTFQQIADSEGITPEGARLRAARAKKQARGENAPDP